MQELACLAGENSKVLILGYKQFRRGKDNYDSKAGQIKSRQDDLYDYLPRIVHDRWFDVVSFDNLAVQQLDVSRLVSAETWREQYMGDDGSFTMYVDAVNREYAVCSVSEKRHPILDDIKEMFIVVKSERIHD